jgi:hypothetical protein
MSPAGHSTRLPENYDDMMFDAVVDERNVRGVG